MPCKKFELNFTKRHFEKKTEKLAIFKSLPQPFGSMNFIKLRTFVKWPFLFSQINLQGYTWILLEILLSKA